MTHFRKQLKDHNKWSRPIDAEFIDITGNARSSSDYDRTTNKPRGWIPPKHRGDSWRHTDNMPLSSYRKHIFGRFVRGCIYITLACAIGYKWGANNPVALQSQRTPVEIEQWRAEIACNNLVAYKIAKIPETPWDVLECAAYKKKHY